MTTFFGGGIEYFVITSDKLNLKLLQRWIFAPSSTNTTTYFSSTGGRGEGERADEIDLCRFNAESVGVGEIVEAETVFSYWAGEFY